MGSNTVGLDTQAYTASSTLLTFALHGLANAWAMLQTVVKIEWLS